MNITEKIQPIRLLSGSHKDTGSTGQGCFMNVVAYLNGEAQITDQSECVCYVIRPLAIWFNDWLEDEERHGLIPFIERALGSRTDDKAEITRRLKLVVAFAELQRDLAAKYAPLYAAEYAAKSAVYAALSAEYAAKSAKYAAKYAEYAAKSAKYAAEYAEYAAKYAEYAAESAADYAKYAADYAKYAALSAEYRSITKAAMLKLLDEALPKAQEAEPIIYQRAAKLIELSAN